jgi:hypothetical protein
MKDIYSYVTTEESAFNKPINLVDGWSWNFKDHIRRSFLYKNSQFYEKNEDRKNRPFKNIIRPILNIQYRTEGFDVKDIELYVDDPKQYHKSFLVKKFHDTWARENEIDTFIDEVVESYIDYGAVLVKNVNGVRPEVVDLQTLAFCDQTDMLSGAFAIKHFFSPDQLRDMEKVGWGNEANGATIDIETLIGLAENTKQQDVQGIDNQTPSKYIEIYEVHGQFDQKYLGGESDKTVQMVQIIGYYKDQTGNRAGVTLFAKKEKLPFKLLLRDKVFGRACGFGAIEELFEAQKWTNSAEVNIAEMLASASKTLYKTADQAFKTRNNLSNKENGDVLVLGEGKDINQIDTSPRNLVVFNNAVLEWNQHAQVMGSAGESLDGTNPSSGTPFKLQELVTNEAKGIHIYRQGKIAVFIEEIYREWILPYIAKEIIKDNSFLAELSSDEFQQIFDRVITNRSNAWQVEQILSGQVLTPEMVDTKKQELQKELLANGNKQFLSWVKDDFKDAQLKVHANIANKQKNLALLTDKVVNVLRQFIATPQIRQDPDMLKLLNVILESSGLSPILFSGVPQIQQQLAQEQGTQGGTEALQAMTKQNATA